MLERWYAGKRALREPTGGGYHQHLDQHLIPHTVATSALEAGIDFKIVSDQLRQSTTCITQDLYTHVRRSIHDQAAEAVVNLLPGRRAG